MFLDRVDGGKRLARALSAYHGAKDTMVLGIPRGGVVVAAEVASALELPLDIAVAAKVGAPGNPEYAVGAVAPDGEVTPNPSSGFSADEVRGIAGAAHEKVARYLGRLRGDRPALDVKGMTVLLVDDGLATGLTAMAAADWLRREGADKVVVAVPVAPPDSVDLLGHHADEVIALETPRAFFAVGQFYQVFGQTEDDEVEALLGIAGGVGG